MQYGATSWSDDEVGKLVQLVIDGQHTYPEIAELLGRSPDSCRHKARDLGLKHPKAGRPWSSDQGRNAASLPWNEFSRLYPLWTPGQYQEARGTYQEKVAVPGLQLTDFARLVYEISGDVAVAACVHVPQTDPVMWAKLLSIGERDKLPGLVIAGDIVVADMFSHWPADGVSDSWSFDAELESLRRHLQTALNVFEFIYVLPGNHVGHRLVKVSNGHIKLSHLLSMAGLSDADRDRVVTTDLDYMTLFSGGEEFRLAHSTNYSRRGGQVPVDYATKEECHVIAGNGHIFGHQISPSGKWHGWDLGTMANPKYMGYAMRGLTKYPKMTQSFVTVKNGTVKVYGSGKPTTDWEVELGFSSDG